MHDLAMSCHYLSRHDTLVGSARPGNQGGARRSDRSPALWL